MTPTITPEEIAEYVFNDKYMGQHITRTISWYGIDFTFHLDPKIVCGTDYATWWTIEKPQLSEETKQNLISIINS